jgi:Tfp pilus assembly protein PilO
MKKIHLIGGIAIGLGVILAVYLGWLLFLSPVNKRIVAAETTLASKKAELQEAETKKAQHEKFRAEAENVSRNLAFVKSRMDSRFGPNDVYRVFNSLDSGLGLRNYSLKTLKPGKSAGMDEFPVEVAFESTYHQVGELVNTVLSRRRIIVPKSLKLVNLSSRGVGESVKATMGFSVFAESGGAAPAAPAAPPPGKKR